MTNFNTKLFLRALAVVVLFESCRANTDIYDILNDAKDLSYTEINALRPLFDKLQLQYDVIVSKSSTKCNEIDDQFEDEYEATWQELEHQYNTMFLQKSNAKYDTALPTAEKIIDKPEFSLLTTEQQMEFFDMQSILQDALDEIQTDLNTLATRALLLETDLLKLNIPKMALLILKAARKGVKAAARIGRAAYCTYSYMPQLNTSLHLLFEGVDCYLYTTSLIVKIQKETYQTVATVKKNIFELADVYKKVAKKNSLMGKIVSVILNVTRIVRSSLDVISTAKHVVDSVENQLPTASQKVPNCSSNFIYKIPLIIESVSNVTECILFVADAETEYDFMEPEEEYYKDTNHVKVNMDNEDEGKDVSQ